MRRLAAIVVVFALAGCGQATRVGALTGPLLGFSVRASGPVDDGVPVAVRSFTQAMSVDRSRVASVSCRAGAPLHRVGTVAPGVVARWTSLLDSAHLTKIHSDPPGGAGRVYRFSYRGRVVTLHYERHLRRAPCVATECMAMLRMDATLRAVLPAATALSGFIATHCPAA